MFRSAASYFQTVSPVCDCFAITIGCKKKNKKNPAILIVGNACAKLVEYSLHNTNDTHQQYPIFQRLAETRYLVALKVGVIYNFSFCSTNTLIKAKWSIAPNWLKMHLKTNTGISTSPHIHT